MTLPSFSTYKDRHSRWYRHRRANNFFTWPSRFIKQSPWAFEAQNRPVKWSKRASLARSRKISQDSCNFGPFSFRSSRTRTRNICLLVENKTRRARLDGQMMFDCRCLTCSDKQRLHLHILRSKLLHFRQVNNILHLNEQASVPRKIEQSKWYWSNSQGKTPRM